MSSKEPCEACLDIGWLIVAVDGDESNLQIQRCDLCERFESDEAAQASIRQAIDTLIDREAE